MRKDGTRTFIDGQGAGDEGGTEDGAEEEDHLPVGGVVGAGDLELGVEVEGEVEEASPGGGGVARGHGLEGIVDGFLVAGADGAVVHEVREADTGGGCGGVDARLADGVEVGTEAADEPFYPDLEDGGGDEALEEAHGGGEEVVCAAAAGLEEAEEKEGDKEGDEGGCPDGNDFFAEGVCELGVHDLAVLEVDGEGAARGGRCALVST